MLGGPSKENKVVFLSEQTSDGLEFDDAKAELFLPVRIKQPLLIEVSEKCLRHKGSILIPVTLKCELEDVREVRIKNIEMLLNKSLFQPFE